MEWAHKRQLKYLMIVLSVILLSVAFIAYRLFFSQPATCFDNKQNGAESGIDCGGACERICLAEQRELMVHWARPSRVTDNVYNAVAYIENRNKVGGSLRDRLSHPWIKACNKCSFCIQP